MPSKRNTFIYVSTLKSIILFLRHLLTNYHLSCAALILQKFDAQTNNVASEPRRHALLQQSKAAKAKGYLGGLRRDARACKLIVCGIMSSS
jgi:hypothetical protein